MNCLEGMDLMQRHMDRDLTAVEERELMAHLQGCAECAEMFERLQLLSMELENLPKVTPPYSIVDSILSELDHIDAAAVPAAESARHVIPLPQRGEASGRAAKKKSRWFERISYKTFGGVVAAGIAFGFIYMNMQSDSVRQNAGSADEMLMQQYQTADAAEKATADDTTLFKSMDANPEGALSNDVGNAEAGAGNDSESVAEKFSADQDTSSNKADPSYTSGDVNAKTSDGSQSGAADAPGSNSPEQGAGESGTESQQVQNGIIDTPAPDGSKGLAAEDQYGNNAAGDGDPTVVDSTPANDQEEEEVQVGITSVDGTTGDTPADTSQEKRIYSKDRSAYVLVENGWLTVKKDADGAVLYSVKLPEGATVSALLWSDDGKSLSYELTVEQTKEQITIDLTQNS